MITDSAGHWTPGIYSNRVGLSVRVKRQEEVRRRGNGLMSLGIKDKHWDLEAR